MTIYSYFNLATIARCLCFAVIVSLYIAFSWALRLGFDLTDEGFYLMMVSFPESYHPSTSMFGQVLSPLWTLSNGSIYFYRLICWWTILLLSFVLFTELLSKSHSAINFDRYLLAATFSLSVVAHLFLWLPTPNYNTVTLVALLLFGIAFASFEDWNLGRIFSIAIAATLAFLAKPTSAVALAFISVFICIYLPSNYRFSRRVFALMMAGVGCVAGVSVFAFA